MRLLVLLAGLTGLPLLAADADRPKLIDAHVHYNGDPAFLAKFLAKLESVNGQALLIAAPKDIPAIKEFTAAHPGRFHGLGQMSLDHPDALKLVDEFHNAGFRGLGELTGPEYPFDDRRYWPIYERAEKYGMILLFHTGIVNRRNFAEPMNVSSDRMRVSTLDLIARRFPKLTLIAAHLGNPDYEWAAEIGRWNPNLLFDVSGSTLYKKQADLTFFKSIFWWDNVVSPHTPKTNVSAFEKLVFGSDVFGGEIAEFDRELDLYRKLLAACGVAPASQENIFSGTLAKVLARQK
ncbi:MAG: amidohydrolase family protein [Acidobacteriota bacterium]|jgi:predicted TIM-barrel fold metal-dependent hydrolase|nr:amidohydrolase [Bryobacteraceae bacterium CoA2 C42]MCA2962386.1 amidohydrolase family protein [Acidobacteriaceae bacterium]